MHAQRTLERRRQALAVLCCTGLLALALPVSADLPGGLSVEALSIGLEPEAVWTLPVGDSSYTVTLQKPSAWREELAHSSLLLEPSPNPDDLGLLILLSQPGSLSPEARIRQAAAALLNNPVEGTAQALALPADSHELGKIGQAPNGQELGGTGQAPNRQERLTISYRGTFDNGRDARMMFSAWTEQGVDVLVVAGASEDVFGPYRQLLRDLIAAVRVGKST
jgi:hypothetical protein